MKKQAMPVIFAIAIILVSIVVIIVGNIIDKNTPSNKHISDREMKELYLLFDGYTMEGDKVDFSNAKEADKNQIAIILQNQLVSGRAVLEDGKIYLSYEFVKDFINDKFYWDHNENYLIYTTPTDVIKAEVGSNDYFVSKVKNTEEYQIVKTEGNDTYIAIDFVKKYSAIEYSFYENPNRLLLRSKWDETVDTAVVKKDVAIRTDKNIKSDIIYKCKDSTNVEIIEPDKKWSKVITENGFFGYVENESLTKKSSKTYTTDFESYTYTSIGMSETVSLGWHLVTSKSANEGLVDIVTPAKGLNVVAPTWYRLSDNEGNMSSLVSENYIKRAHMVGLDVWAVVDDQSPDSDNKLIFTYTSKREKIINQLVADAINYGIDGINVDFEYITEDIADDYIQFIRELSVKCRINGIVLSVDNKVPAESNLYYNIKAQGEVVDYVIIMGYDEHWGADSGAGSVASLPWVTKGVEDVVAAVDSKKVINAIPFYTRIWTEDSSGNVVDVSAVGLGVGEKQLAGMGVTPVWVENVGQNYGEYSSGETTVRIWLEDAKSIEEKLKLIGKYNLAGVAAWRLGLENEEIWNTIIKYTN